jgi:hypothetical protein
MSEEEIHAKYTEGKSLLRGRYPAIRGLTLWFAEELLDLGDKSPLYRYVICAKYM